MTKRFNEDFQLLYVRAFALMPLLLPNITPNLTI